MAQAITGGLRGRRLFLKSTATIVAAAFLSLSLQPLGFAADAAPAPAPSAQSPGPDARLAKTLDTLEARLGKLDQKLTRGEDAAAELADIARLRSELDPLDAAIARDFEQIGQHLKAKGLPAIILERHAQALAGYKQEMATLKANLDALNQAPSATERTIKAKKAAEHLKAKQKKRTHQGFDPAELPFRTPEGKYRRPKTAALLTAEPVKVAALALLPGMLANATLGAASPGAADLAETVEIQLTPEIRALAQGLNTPVAIYEFVRNGFAFEPYAGSLKGAALTLKERAGNDWDLASLLIALYRAAGIPARYVVGSAEIPAERAMSWLGAEDPQTAANLLASLGRNASAIVSGGRIAAIRTDRVWVRAYVPFNHHRGAKSGPGDTWVDLDPGFKLHEVTQTLKPAALPAFDQSAYLATLRTDGALDFYKAQLQTFLDAANPGHTPDAIERRAEIVPEAFGVLVGTLPYKAAAQYTYTAAPDVVRQKLTLNVLDNLGSTQLTYSATLVELLDKRLTLSYSPATQADADTIAAYGSLYQTPPYLIELKPLVKLEGQAIADGPPLGAAQEQTLELQFSTPNGVDTARNTVTAGEYYAVALNAHSGSGSHQEVLDRAKRLQAIQDKINLNDPATLDERLGELLYLTGRVYHHNVTSADRKLAALANVIDAREASEMMYFLATKIVYTFGIPRSMTPFGITADMDRNVHLVMPRDGNPERIKLFMQLECSEGSYYEHATTEAVYQAQALSAVKALQLAKDQGIPVHTVTPENADLILPALQVSGEVRTDIQTALHQGWQAIVPQQNLTLQDWSGVGYILQNPENGEGYYRIAGGYNGAMTLSVLEIEDRLNSVALGGFGVSALSASERKYYKVCYPGWDGIPGTPDDSCYTPYLPEEVEQLIANECDLGDDICLHRYATDPANSEITQMFLIDSEEGGDRFLTKHLRAKQWRSQDEARYMRAGQTVIRAIHVLMKTFGVIDHGIRPWGAGYATWARQIERGICRSTGSKPESCKYGHHLDGTAADIYLNTLDPEALAQNPNLKPPTKEQVLCIADYLMPNSEVLDEGTDGTVHIARPARGYSRDPAGTRMKSGKTISWSWNCTFWPTRTVR